MLPARGLVSWEAHLFGLIAGDLAVKKGMRGLKSGALVGVSPLVLGKDVSFDVLPLPDFQGPNFTLLYVRPGRCVRDSNQRGVQW